jgi:hypothetical protein
MNFIELLYTLFEVGKTKIKVQSWVSLSV